MLSDRFARQSRGPATATQAGPARGRAFALITVMAVLGLMAALLTGLFTLSQTEMHGARRAQAGEHARLLAEVASNVVIQQIRAATSELGTDRTWASQPGLIRRFGLQTDPATGRAALESAYKLYSNAVMTAGPGFDPLAEVPPTDWSDRPGLWIDLNQPARGHQHRSWPVIDPAAIGMVAGLEIGGEAPGATAGQPLPLPVQWIYQLRDGRLVAPSDWQNGEVRFGAGGPTADNPVVGRIAFWTDDETAKVNLNTASEGVFWDMPRGNTHFDAFNYADKQPVRNEFQRYPGHPAMNRLSGLFADDLGTQPAAYYALAPRIANGGSYAGTVNVNASTPPITPPAGRLFASNAEFLLQPNRQLNFDGVDDRPLLPNDRAAAMMRRSDFFVTTHSRAPEVNLFNQPRIALWPIQADPRDRNPLDQLIAHCATVAGHPYYLQRASVHNLSQPAAGHGSALSPTTDANLARNRQLYQYLRHVTSRDIPGFGGRFGGPGGKYAQDRDQIVVGMLDYLRSGLNTYALGLPTGRDSRGYTYSAPRQIGGMGSVRGESQVVPLEIDGLRGFGRFFTITEAAIVFYPTDHADEPDMTASVPTQGNIPAYRARSMRAFLLLEFFTPSPGLPSWSPYASITLSGLENFTVDGRPLNIPVNVSTPRPGSRLVVHTPIGSIPNNDRHVGAGHSCAHLSLFQPLFHGTNQRRDVNSSDPMSGFAWHSRTDIQLSGQADTMTFSGGRLSIRIATPDDQVELQTMQMDFPPATIPRPHAYGNPEHLDGNGNPIVRSLETNLRERINQQPEHYDSFLIRPGDVVRAVEASVTAPPRGDLRHYLARRDVPAEWFTKGGKPGEYDSPTARFAHGLRNGNFWQYWGHFRTRTTAEHGEEAIDARFATSHHLFHPFYRDSSAAISGQLVRGMKTTSHPVTGQTWRPYRDYHAVGVRGMTYAARGDGRSGDWDQGFGNTEDGPFINKPDETSGSQQFWNWGNFHHAGGYFRRGNFTIDAEAVNHVPNRQIASAVMFGSLPTGIHSGRPWETLLFSPNPAGRTTPALQAPTAADHIGFSFPRDHLLLDLFWMPVVEPYALSDVFSTAGAVNMNYEIMPFRYLRRRSAVHAVLDGLQMMAVPPEAATRWPHGCYKGGRDQAYAHELRYNINLDPARGTLRGFEERFQQGDVFRSASEICEIFLVPQPMAGSPYPPAAGNPEYAAMTTFWQRFDLTGDNVRESPYNQLLPRLTTKSNTYRVHVRAQSLQPARGGRPDRWVESRDRVTGEWRGSFLIERFVDPDDPGIPDFMQQPEASLDDHYRFRVIEQKRFLP